MGLREADKETKGSHRGIVGTLCLGGSGEGDRVGTRRTSKRLSKKRHYGLLSKFPVIIILMDLISLQFAVVMFSVSCHMLQ